MQDVKLYTQNAPQYEGDCEYRISSICLILILVRDTYFWNNFHSNMAIMNLSVDQTSFVNVIG